MTRGMHRVSPQLLSLQRLTRPAILGPTQLVALATIEQAGAIRSFGSHRTPDTSDRDTSEHSHSRTTNSQLHVHASTPIVAGHAAHSYATPFSYTRPSGDTCTVTARLPDGNWNRGAGHSLLSSGSTTGGVSST